MKSRVVAGMLAGMLTVALAGCSGAAPKASPSPTPPFASADAAYEAAEATYRGYVDALNKVDLNDPKTFEPVYEWLLGKSLDENRKSLTWMSSQHLEVGGTTNITFVKPVRANPADERWGDVRLAACLDVSDVTLTDAEGNSKVATDGSPIQAVKVTLARDGATATGMKIVSVQRREGAPACGK